jgi:hypothetical protein
VIVIAGVDVAFATDPENPLAVTTETLVTVPDPPPPVYCGMLRVLPMKVAAPDVPVVVSVIGAW